MDEDEVAYLSIKELQRLMTAGELTSVDLVRACLERIAAFDREGPSLHAVLQVNEDAETLARALDAERMPCHAGLDWFKWNTCNGGDYE